MLLVVFGAGASYDSAATYPVPKPEVGLGGDYLVEQSRPPLADRLFENRGWFAEALKLFPTCQPLVTHLRHLSRDKNLEQVLATYLNEAGERPERHCQIMAVRYYLAYIIKNCENQWEGVHKGVTNYRTLLDQIESWRRRNHEAVCLVTFNYDRMLEVACFDIGLRFEKFEDYITSENYKLFKLHGCVNWGRYTTIRQDSLPHLNASAVANELTERAASLELTDAFTLISQQPPPMPPLPDRLAIIPAIAIPIENKDAFECPIEHVEVLKQCLPSTTRMLTIGWRATEGHFLKLLGEGLPRTTNLMVIAGSQKEAMEVGAKLQPRRLDIDAATAGFTDSILSREVEKFLWREPSSPVFRHEPSPG